MTAVAKLDLVLIAGEPFSDAFYYWTLNTKAEDGTLTPVNLTGCTARLQIRADFDTATKTADWTTENGKLVLGGTAGTVKPAVTATETAALWTTGLSQQGVYQGRTTYRLGYWDLEILTGSIPRRWLHGIASICPEVTK